MTDIKDKVIKNLLEQIEELNKRQYISESNINLFIELSNKLGGFKKINNEHIKLKYDLVEYNSFADIFLILVSEYINENNKGE